MEYIDQKYSYVLLNSHRGSSFLRMAADFSVEVPATKKLIGFLISIFRPLGSDKLLCCNYNKPRFSRCEAEIQSPATISCRNNGKLVSVTPPMQLWRQLNWEKSNRRPYKTFIIMVVARNRLRRTRCNVTQGHDVNVTPVR